MERNFLSLTAVIRCVNTSPASRQITVTQEDKTREFEFDVVFDEASTQAQIYNEIGAPAVSNVVHGYNSTIFAYGQVFRF
jgi:hypothetical protein